MQRSSALKLIIQGNRVQNDAAAIGPAKLRGSPLKAQELAILILETHTFGRHVVRQRPRACGLADRCCESQHVPKLPRVLVLVAICLQYDDDLRGPRRCETLASPCLRKLLGGSGNVGCCQEREEPVGAVLALRAEKRGGVG